MSKILNPEQLKGATHRDGPLLVLAGAGSGKTRIVAYRITYLIDQGIPPSQILAVTFTNKAAKEMQERVYDLLKGGYHEEYPTVSTFHSLGAKILRESIDKIGYDPNFTIYDEEDSGKLLRTCLQSLGIKKEKGEIRAIRSLISKTKNQLIDPEGPPFFDIYSLYQERLKEANALDFDDLLYLTVRLFKESPETRAFYQKQWPYLLIDEYQDTNPAQYMIAQMIVEHSHNIFVVGDPDQSIYSWRGANIQNILNFEKNYPGAQTVRLEQNYRSSSNILEAANALIQNNVSRFKKNLWSDKGAGEKITLFVGRDERDEASFVIREIERLHSLFKIPLSEITIFYRTNFQSRLFEDFLLRRDLPYVIVGGISFYQRKEIKDVLGYLRMVESDCDAISFMRTINLPKRGIGQTTLEKILANVSGSFLDFCENPVDIRLSAKQKAGLANYASIIRELRALKGEVNLQELVYQTVEKTGYLDVLREDKETFEDRKENVDELIAKARESDCLQAFLEELSLKGSLDEADFTQDQINLMTLHNGKGLEFTAAFLVGMEEDLFPHVNSRESYDALEEERRLCYVGMTRAKERLYLSAAETRFLWGTHRMMRPSRFLREIPRQYINRLQ
ncbi:MAG: ATP-dependent DNA helicase PcrA [Chlamydiales bacterium]|nr:ATP-dependent DNA helicase PcrA [Chlamydiales bacterium]MCH9619559.1 ATP-dependent DNA helicase PcrA [Chlamydiales bacterium]MCH9623165.1 ATP-dependent DNA helicase PcrA [Chlamydiales bacterium]